MRKLLMIVLGMCLMAGGVSAQQNLPPVCGDLSDADCEIVEKSAQVMTTLRGATFTMEGELGVENMPTMEAFGMTFSIDGSYDGNTAAAALEPGETLDNDAALEQAVEQLSEFSGEMNITVSVSEDLVPSSEFLEDLQLQLRIVDGVGYINFDTLRSLLVESATTADWEGWGGVDFVDAIEQYMPLLRGLSANTTTSDQLDPEILNEYAAVTREADADGAAVFVTEYDLAEVIRDPAFEDLLRQQLATQGAPVTDEEIDMIITALSSSENTRFSTTQVIDLETLYLRSASLDLTFDLGVLIAASGTALSPEDIERLYGGPIVMTFTGEIAYADYNDVPAITAPEDAEIIPVLQLLQLISQAGSTSSF